MNRVGNSDTAAFEIIVERHSGSAFSLAYRITKQRSLAEAAVQATFLALWHSGNRYDDTHDSVRSWTLRDVHSRAIALVRRDRVHGSGSAGDRELVDRVTTPERPGTEGQQHENDQLRAALERLPADQSRVLELAYFDGFTHTEIATMLDLPAGSVKGRMRLGLEQLRAHLLGQEAAT